MRKSLVCLLLLALAAVCAAQDGGKKEAKPRPDLTGTWVLDRSGHGVSRKFDSTLVITHRDPELRIVRTDVMETKRLMWEYVYYTDGRGESNPMDYGTGRIRWIRSKTKWKGDRVEARIGGFWRRWQLSADGQTLTHTYSTGYIPVEGLMPQPTSIKLVYRRAP